MDNPQGALVLVVSTMSYSFYTQSYNSRYDVSAVRNVRGATQVRARQISEQRSHQHRLGWISGFLGLVMLGLVILVPRASADAVLLDGIITDGEFLAPQFISNPNEPGGGSIMNVDQLRLTGTTIEIGLEFSGSTLTDTLLDGYSFLIFDANGNTTDSNLSLTGTLGDPTLGGFTFQNTLRSAGQIAEISGGALNLALFVSGTNNAAPRLSASPAGLLTLTSPQLPANVTTVGDLVSFLQTTSDFTNGTFPIEFFTTSGSGDTMLASANIPFEINVSTTEEEPLPAVPLPAAVWMFLSGLAALGAMKRSRKLA